MFFRFPYRFIVESSLFFLENHGSSLRSKNSGLPSQQAGEYFARAMEANDTLTLVDLSLGYQALVNSNGVNIFNEVFTTSYKQRSIIGIWWKMRRSYNSSGWYPCEPAFIEDLVNIFRAGTTNNLGILWRIISKWAIYRSQCKPLLMMIGEIEDVMVIWNQTNTRYIDIT